MWPRPSRQWSGTKDVQNEIVHVKMEVEQDQDAIRNTTVQELVRAAMSGDE